MSEKNREIQELLVDYSNALRDGCIPMFLKSLSREEAKTIATCPQFQDTTEIVRILNDVGFAHNAVTPNVGLFISRVDTEISSRLKRARASSRGRYSSRTRPVNKMEKKTEKPI